jgi:hypothetical protein
MALDLISSLRALLEGHGIATIDTPGHLVFGNGIKVSPVLVSSQDKPDGKLIQLDVRVESPVLGNRVLIESFAGYDADDSKATLQALKKFWQSSLHVLLAVLYDKDSCADQVEWETWESPTAQWRVCVGPLLLQHSPNIDVEYGEFLDSLRDKLLPKLNNEIHWFRSYFMKNGRDRMGSESLLDNYDWREGQNVLDSWPWPDGFYSVRNFLMLIPQNMSESGGLSP